MGRFKSEAVGKHKNNCEKKRSVSQVPGNVRLGTARLGWEHTEKHGDQLGAPRLTQNCVFHQENQERQGYYIRLKMGWFE